MMLIYMIRIKLLLCFIAILSCSSPMSQIDTFQKELLSEVEEILCPNIKFIEGLDRITITNQKSDLYKLKFHEVKWKCYSNIISSNEITDNIDLDITSMDNFIISFSQVGTDHSIDLDVDGRTSDGSSIYINQTGSNRSYSASLYCAHSFCTLTVTQP